MYDKAIATTGEEDGEIEEAANIERHALRGCQSRSMKASTTNLLDPLGNDPLPDTSIQQLMFGMLR